MEQQQDRRRGGVIWIVLLLLSVGLNIYQWRNHETNVYTYEEKVKSLVDERVDVEKELADSKSELEKYRGISANLDSLLNEAQAKLDSQATRIRQLNAGQQNSKELNQKLKQQLADLQMLRDEYLTRIDSLLMMNKQLVSEKEELSTHVQTLSKNLESTVATASVLKSEYLKVQTFKRRGSGKYVETALAKRTNKVDVCFDVLENKIAKKGEKTIYMKITEPGGKPIGNRSTGSNTFKLASGEEMMYATSQVIDFDGNKQNLCMSYEELEEKMFTPGTYMIEIYVDGNISGAGSFVLR